MHIFGSWENPILLRGRGPKNLQGFHFLVQAVAPAKPKTSSSARTQPIPKLLK